MVNTLKNLYNYYGKELLSFFVEMIATLGIFDEGLKEDLGLLDDEKSYRIFYKTKQRFRDIIGITSILPELGELVWFLRTRKRTFSFGKVVPKGLLFIGPPGTGKTLIVKAIAGEAQVPVIVQSGSAIVNTGRGLSDRLYDLFQEAKQISPCILFIDEIDALGEKRTRISPSVFSNDVLIEALYDFDPEGYFTNSNINLENFMENDSENYNEEDYSQFILEEENLNDYYDNTLISQAERVAVFENEISKSELSAKRINLLTQLLVELDGLHSREGVFVIGATNRFDVLDPALTRPGRFDQILKIPLPNEEKRIEILKLYSKKLGTNPDLTNWWNYIAKVTLGFSAADLATIVNESAIKAIIQDTLHTLETIEKGIDFVTGYSAPKFNKKNDTDPFILTRFAYYQTGKLIINNTLADNPPIVVVNLIPKPVNSRFLDLYKNDLSKINTKKI